MLENHLQWHPSRARHLDAGIILGGYIDNLPAMSCDLDSNWAPRGINGEYFAVESGSLYGLRRTPIADDSVRSTCSIR